MRIAACASLATVVACASLAGLEEPDPAADKEVMGRRLEEDSAPPSLVPSSSSSSSSGSAPSDASSAPDTKPSGDGCALAQNGSTCNKDGDCCSTKCRENHKCENSCKTQGQGCSIGSDDQCCLGLWCAGALGAACAPCIASGQKAASAGIPLRNSCCTRALKAFPPDECQ